MVRGDIFHIPPGMRDWLPGEARRKREAVNRMLKAISLWGYEEINTPLMEYYQVLLPGENLGGPDQLYKLTDRDGRILALRSEMTTPIARVISSKLPVHDSQRLMYGGEVFRYEEIQTGKQREFCQVGVELIGEKGPEADSEVLAIAIEALQAAGLENFTISLGHTGVLKSLSENFTGNETQLNEVRKLLLEKDFVGLSSCLSAAGMKKEKAEKIMSLLTRQFSASDLEQLQADWEQGQTNPEGQQADLPPELAEAFTGLRQTIQYLKLYGYEQYIQVDLSTLRSQEYYTGMVFEIYTPGIGYPIGGGGRYDELLRHFGKDYAATGFALGVERILLSLPQDTIDKAEGQAQARLVLVAGTDSGRVMQRAKQLRMTGRRVITEAEMLTRSQAEERARGKGAALDWWGEEETDEE